MPHRLPPVPSSAVRVQVDWPAVRRFTRRAVLAAAITPVATAAALMVLDKVRGQRYPLDKRFPTAPPVTSRLGESSTTVYTYGADLYRDMLTAIRGARTQILLESYIWKGDEVGTEFKQAVIEAAERGVDVYIVYDMFANLVVPRSFYDFPPRVHVLRFPVVRPAVLISGIRHSGRDHRKILVVDDETAFVGGYNIGSLYATHWRDTHLRVTGPSVWELRNAFVDFWNRWRADDLPILQDIGSPHWLPHLRAARNAPSELVFPIRGLYLDAIDRACSHIYITQAYFIPDRDILTALLNASARGVDVRVLVPERSNHVVADWLARGHYATLLRGGVRIFLYQGAMIHAKTATVDGAWSTVGTANIDRLSLTGNYEINLEIVDRDVAARLEDTFRMDLSNAREITLEEWQRRPVLKKLAELVLSPLRPLL